MDAVSLSGSSFAGWTAQEICARRRIPLQAELGGNNAAVVWEAADLQRGRTLVAHGAFAFAGQRCTANRRAIVARAFDAFLAHLTGAAAALAWGDPLDPATQVGPLVSDAARDRVAAAVARAAAAGARIVAPHGAAPRGRGAYYPPTIVSSPPTRARSCRRKRSARSSWSSARGISSRRSSSSTACARDSWRPCSRGPAPGGSASTRALAGILKWDTSTADADSFAPFGGWKASGVGPPEHGAANVEFYTRLQAIYGGS